MSSTGSLHRTMLWQRLLILNRVSSLYSLLHQATVINETKVTFKSDVNPVSNETFNFFILFYFYSFFFIAAPLGDQDRPQSSQPFMSEGEMEAIWSNLSESMRREADSLQANGESSTRSPTPVMTDEEIKILVSNLEEAMSDLPEFQSG